MPPITGPALPSMLSAQFLPRGTKVDDGVAAGMTADALRYTVATSSTLKLLGRI